MESRQTIVDDGAFGERPLPVRKVLNHRGPISIDVTNAWYFVTICSEGHTPWTVGGAPRAPRDSNCRAIPLAEAAEIFLREAREYHMRGIWRLALFLVMPDHLHFIVRVPNGGAFGERPLPAGMPREDGGAFGERPLPNRSLACVMGGFKRLLTRRYGLRFQRDFFDTRLRDDAHYGEKFYYVCANPVRKGLCETPCEWHHVIAFDRETGNERMHK